MEYPFDFIEKKIVQAARRRDKILRGQVERMAASLAPRGGLQEKNVDGLAVPGPDMAPACWTRRWQPLTRLPPSTGAS